MKIVISVDYSIFWKFNRNKKQTAHQSCRETALDKSRYREDVKLHVRNNTTSEGHFKRKFACLLALDCRNTFEKLRLPNPK